MVLRGDGVLASQGQQYAVSTTMICKNLFCDDEAPTSMIVFRSLLMISVASHAGQHGILARCGQEYGSFHIRLPHPGGSEERMTHDLIGYQGQKTFPQPQHVSPQPTEQRRTGFETSSLQTSTKPGKT